MDCVTVVKSIPISDKVATNVRANFAKRNRFLLHHIDILHICILKRGEKVTIGRTEHGSDLPERHHEVAVSHFSERPSESDTMKSLAFSLLRTVLDDPGATSQSDLPRSLPIQSDPLERHTKAARDLSPGDTKNRPWSDFLERDLQVAPRYFAAENHDFLRTFLQFILDPPGRLSFDLNTQKLSGEVHLLDFDCYVEGLEGQEELCFINNNGSWYKKEPNFQYNNYQQKSYPNNQQSGYPPRNNQQGSYQPQQNPSSGSSAPQESSTDTLLKQILESQTRSEKHIGYELKNLHSKIDGSYNELNNKFSHLASTLKRGEKVTIGRTEHGSDLPERHHEVAVSHFSERPS
ncbi:hypothetical protein IGI04_029344 [Brassica rapa subsp. trilocularis]|uniref:Uncharacterized protein n=1 Tax=Brassica rapa subsp. trilocularis TaxID=1813537 RepID=A0ABQ7LMK3_BRACM|nr:hypothetical protein IGI04_029344 [Brassica rapa subsp. trilocularis]